MIDNPIDLLKQLIATPSFSGEEDGTAAILFSYLQNKGVNPKQFRNNVWARNANYAEGKPTLLLNSHHDTVKPSSAYTNDPFEPIVKDGILFGLGSNDAGASVVSLIDTFCTLYNADLPYNIVLAITAEEEAMCNNGITALWDELGPIDFAIVGEPTQMLGAVAERGLLVLDCEATGKAGHAARNEGENALYKAIDDINWFRTFKFPKVSERMGDVKMTATIISAGTQHNVIPDKCKFVVDIRPTDVYTNREIVDIVAQHVQSTVTPRSLHLNASSIDDNHPLVKTVVSMGIKTYISPTTSDISRIPVPSLKIGPGDSARSHTADEYIVLSEIENGIETYKAILNNLISTI